jgi:hypothetical protein
MGHEKVELEVFPPRTVREDCRHDFRQVHLTATRFVDVDGKWGAVRPSEPEAGYLNLSFEGNIIIVRESDGPPKLGGAQRNLSPSPTNVCQKRRREETGKRRAEGVDWQEAYEDLHCDFIR